MLNGFLEFVAGKWTNTTVSSSNPLPMIPKQCGYAWDKALDEVDGKWYVLSF